MRPITYLYIFYKACDVVYVMTFIAGVLALFTGTITIIPPMATICLYCLEREVARMLQQYGVTNDNLEPLL